MQGNDAAKRGAWLPVIVPGRDDAAAAPGPRVRHRDRARAAELEETDRREAWERAGKGWKKKAGSR
jgi:hypothetical protein